MITIKENGPVHGKTQAHLFTAYCKTPIGYLRISGNDEGIRKIDFTELQAAPHSNVHPCLRPCLRQLSEYFAGSREEFSLELNPAGTRFQKAVWMQLLNIPYGQTSTYLAIARQLGNEKSLRAVGAANGKNPIPIVIPCHRVIGSNGALIGFGGGIWRKEFLLRHENVVLV